MKTPAEADKNQPRYVATVGMFDGVHRGHVFLLRKLAEVARERGLEPMVFTFAGHPMCQLAPCQAPKTLTTAAQRADMIRQATGINRVEILDPKPELLSLTGNQFLHHIHDTYAVDAFLMGFNNHIGSDRADASALASACMPVIVMPELPAEYKVNSSTIRQALAEGRIEDATDILGHRWHYRGHVVHGRQLGRTIGFPTANIEPLEACQLLPKPGVYAVDVTLPEGRTLRGMANIGHRPTVDCADAPMSFEVNIFDCDADLYGTVLDVAFLGRLRDERPFSSVEALRLQLVADREAARRI